MLAPDCRKPFSNQKEKETAAEKLEQIKATGLKPGSIVNFGIYGKTFDKHPIEWTILDKQDQKILLFSNQILAEEEYNKSSRDDDSDLHVTWENCSLRKWLNDDFYNDAFSTYEQKWITESTVTTDEYDTWDADAKILYESDFTSGIATEQETQDKVFLLSPREVMKYFDSQEELLKKYDTDFCEDWWLRSDGQYDSSSSYYYSAEEEHMYMYVRSYLDNDGWAIDVDGSWYYSEMGVCPAIWLDLSALGELIFVYCNLSILQEGGWRKPAPLPQKWCFHYEIERNNL